MHPNPNPDPNSNPNLTLILTLTNPNPNPNLTLSFHLTPLTLPSPGAPVRGARHKVRYAYSGSTSY